MWIWILATTSSESCRIVQEFTFVKITRFLCRIDSLVREVKERVLALS